MNPAQAVSPWLLVLGRVGFAASLALFVVVLFLCLRRDSDAL